MFSIEFYRDAKTPPSISAVSLFCDAIGVHSSPSATHQAYFFQISSRLLKCQSAFRLHSAKRYLKSCRLRKASKAMDYKKATHCVIISLMVIVACRASSDSNNVIPKVDSYAKKTPGRQQKPVNVNQRSLDECYDGSRDCWHYENERCLIAWSYTGSRNYTIGGLKCRNWYSHGRYPGYPENHCRNPDKSAGPWCYTGNAWDYCFRWCNMDSCYNSSRNCFHYGKTECLKKYTYMGTRNTTIDGIRCQPWKEHTVHLAGNLCRDPYGGKHGPYCHINSQSMEWNYCFADCSADVCYDGSRGCFHYEKPRCWHPYSYLGTREYAIDGTSCDKWTNHNSDLPKKYCRLQYGGKKAPWCFTKQGGTTFKYCFPDCKDYDCYDRDRKCFHYEKPECQKANSYSGSRSYTFDGVKCQDWALSKGKYVHLDKNYCRNPDGKKKGPWCYAAVGKKDWDYCFRDCLVSDCFMNNVDNYCYSRKEKCWKHYLYNGTRNFNLDGTTCQYWNTTDYKYLPENKCRNPNNRKGPWCYTKKRGTEWNYCFPKDCDVGDCYDSSRDCYHYERRQCRQMNGYTGTKHHTLSGLKCEDWSAAYVKGVPKNYCRVIYGKSGPWCYAKNAERAYFYCFSRCDADNCYDSSRDCFHYEKASCRGYMSYIGTRNYSMHGHACQKWNSQGRFIYAGNLCHSSNYMEAPFCYISKHSNEWNYCFKDCNADRCYDRSRDCYHYAKEGCITETSYVGNRDYDKRGNKCMRWSIMGGTYPKNYCRLDFLRGRINAKGPWCWISKKLWSYCFLDCDEKEPIVGGYSCGMYHDKEADCLAKARLCDTHFETDIDITDAFTGRCVHLSGDRYHCICQRV